MTITIEVDGLQDVNAALRKYGRDAEAGLSKAVTATALDIQRDVKKRIQRGPKTGAVYDSIFRMINGRPVPVGPREGNNLSPTHQASAPGEAPASDTGGLAKSVDFRQETKLSATIGSRLAYAYYLEFGTARIAPRPSWVPATEAAKPKLRARVEKALTEAAK